MTPPNKQNILASFLQTAAKDLSFPLPFFLILESLFNVQIWTVVLLPSLYSFSSHSESRLSTTLNSLLSYLDPLKVFNPFQSQEIALAITALSLVYIVGFLALIFYAVLLAFIGRKPFEWELKLLTILGIVHSKFVFFVLHCFFTKGIDLSLSSTCSDFLCDKKWAIIFVLLLVINVALLMVKEVFCYTIHYNKRSSYAVKNNLHSVTVAFQKILVVILTNLVNNSEDAVILLNILFTLQTLLILYRRLPFYNITILKLSIYCTSISALFSLTSLARIFNYHNDILLFTFLSIPLIIKISSVILNSILTTILTQSSVNNPYYLAHLPVLIENFYKKTKVFSIDDDNMNRATLYSMAFMAGHIDNFIDLEKEKAKEEVRKFAFNVAATRISDILFRGNNQNELLLVILIQIYLEELQDNFRSLSLINSSLIKKDKLSKQGLISLEIVSGELYHHEDRNQEQRVVHLEYFSYKKKSLAFKNLIRTEIAEHLKLWKMVPEGTIHTFETIKHAQNVHIQSKNITRFWNKHFHSEQYKYVNPCLMYGLYLEVVLALPAMGSELINKAHGLLNNKWHFEKEIVDIVKGKTAVIVASIMPENFGRIVEASSSAKDMFGASMKDLMGSSIEVMMANFVAKKHNQFIKDYQKRFDNHLKGKITSYAKSLNNEYFKVEMGLHLYPMMNQGLSVVACIKKISENETIMILDEDGIIIDCSRDLAFNFELPVKREGLKIKNLSSQLERIDQAFNVVYKPGEEERLIQRITMDDLTKMNIRKESVFENVYENLMSPARLLSTEKESVKGLDFNNGTENDSTNYRGSRKSGRKPMDRDEAERLCQIYKESQQVMISPYGGVGGKYARAQHIYQIEVEPIVLDGSLFKIFKVVKPKESNTDNEEKEDEDVKSPVYNAPRTLKDLEDEVRGWDGMSADNFPTERERMDIPIIVDDQEKSYSLVVENQEKQEVVKETPKKDHGQGQGQGQGQNILKPMKKVKITNKEQSVMESTMGKSANRKFKEALKKENPSRAVRLSILTVYLAVIIIIGSICAGYIYSVSSLGNMSDSMNLISLVNLRLGKTIVAWQSILVVYARSIGLRAIDYKVGVYQSVLVEKSLDMLYNSKDLVEAVNNMKNKEISETFFAKSVTFWDPKTHTLFDNGQKDTIAANNILINYNLYVGRWSQSVLNLNGDEKVLFAINNTANDYFNNLQTTINFVTNFFEKTKENNISLMKIIMGLELLFTLSPLMLISILVYLIIQKHAKLSNVFTKILDSSVNSRIVQLENIAVYFDQPIEDSAIEYDEAKFESMAKISVKGTEKKQKPQRKNYELNGFTKYILKYFLISGALIAAIIALLAVSLSFSVKSLENLDKIKEKVVISYKVGSDIKMILPSFYFAIETMNYTGYTLKYNNATDETFKALYGLGNASRIFLEEFSNDPDFEDSTVFDILNGNVCKYATEKYWTDCGTYTNGNSFGLLGLFTKYQIVSQTVYQYFASPDKGFNYTKQLLIPYGIAIANLHFTIYDVNDYLSTYLVKVFNQKADEDKSKIFSLFVVSLCVVMVSLVVLRGLVLSKLHMLDLAAKKIVNLFPPRMIADNKVISFYLIREMKHELGNLKSFV